MALFCMILGIVCMAYFLCIELFTGHSTNFYYVWLFGGICLVLISIGLKRNILSALPLWTKRTGSILIVVGILLFLIVEGLIISGFSKKGAEDLDYIIVLGAELKPSGPSRVLQLRLDTAYDYLTENEKTVVIVSGGKGINEPDTEAQGMYDYLAAKGINPDRILKEDKSLNTSQNILFSSQFLDKSKDNIGIVTNNFHIFRAVQLAKAAGYEQVQGIAAPSYLYLQPNNMLREFFGVVKDFLIGNLT